MTVAFAILTLLMLCAGVGTLVPTIGKAFWAGKMSGDLTTSPNRVAWGTGTTDPVAGDTALQAESSEARATATLSRVTTTTTNDTFQAVATMTATGTRAITEVGLLDAASGGNLILRATHLAVNVVSGDEITYTIKTQLT